MVLADGDFVHVREHRPPPEHVVSRKKSKHEALLEAAQHLFRGVGHMREEQRECMMRCMAHARRVYREVAQSIYGPAFRDVARFLDGGGGRRSIWQRARQRLLLAGAGARKGGGEAEDEASTSASAGGGEESGHEGEEDEEDEEDDDPLGFAQAVRGFAEEPPGFGSLLPCAVIYPNMHPLDRPKLLKLLLMAVQQQQLARVQREAGRGRRKRARAAAAAGGDGEESDLGESVVGGEDQDSVASASSSGSRRSQRAARDEEDEEEEDDDDEGAGAKAMPPIAVVIRSTQHTTLASILRDVYTEIVAAVQSVARMSFAGAAGARARREAARSAWRGAGPAPHGTLGEVMAAYASLVEAIASLALSGRGGGGRKGQGARLPKGGSNKHRPASRLAPPAPPRPPLLLLFEDVEALSNRLLEDLLRLLAEVSAALPARLVFLVSPAFSLAQGLGCGATATLEPQTFLLPPAQRVLEALLARLFVDAELPVMVSGRVLRLLRVTFRDHHNSVTTFIRHLDFILRMHFSQLPSLLCMLPYDLLPEEQAPLLATTAKQPATALPPVPLPPTQESTASGGQKGGAGGGGGTGDGVLVMTKAECGEFDSHALMVLRNMEALFKAPALRDILARFVASKTAGAAAGAGATTLARSDDHGQQFQCLRILVNQQLGARFELRIGCHLLRQALLLMSGLQQQQQGGGGRGGNGGGGGREDAACPSHLHLAELLLDHERPQRWAAREREGLERLAQASLEDLENVVLSWLDTLRVEVLPVPTYVRRYSQTINTWIAKARELWTLLSALGEEMSGRGKGKKRRGAAAAAAAAAVKKEQENDAVAANKGEAAAAAAGDKDKEAEKAAEAAAAAAEEEAEARRQYRIKSQGIAMDAQAFFAEVAAHCRAVGAAGGYARAAFWFRDTQLLQDAFFAQPRAQAVKALTDSRGYLQCQCCPEGGAGYGWLHPAMPDACLVYGLYEATQGRTLNIRTWFASFVDVVCGGEEEDDHEDEEEQQKGKGKGKGKKRKRGDEGEGEPRIAPEQLKVLWARFLHAVDELEHLGFTRPYGKRGNGDRAKLLFAYTLLGNGGGGGEGDGGGG